MTFEQSIKVPMDRVGVLVGPKGQVKSEVEDKCGVSITVDSKTGEVLVKSKGPVSQIQPFKAVELITAISRGFSPERAFKLLEDESVLDMIDLREYAGKSDEALKRIKGRIIGNEGKSRKIIEELTDALISVYGHTVTIISHVDDIRQTREAIEKLASGSTHQSVYKMLQKARTKAKVERLRLWEGEAPHV